ncbi:MAG: 3-oxoacyl-ACP synthase [Mangrovimonas sp.]|nr:3-oxoacyl-ACP synthase [Mangrovimonas sp.]MCB0434908.1 3-oxoacyl-ACP synthase [Mangrovimonas sp.]MCB0438335.1 3-oxoacyl-ACP synthase [Mangrovimonas sp.]MCB0470609.1 3-oxoacyl-ACP synthase [Flavobacteriaceae bacterium]
MGQPYHIRSFCSIQQETILLNGKPVFKSEQEDFGAFAKEAYQFLTIKYPKFFKMDHLSKLAFLTANLVLDKENITPDEPSNTALVFANSASSLDTDRKHQESIKNKDNYFPSPAIFVYTLPNICLGEISIKYKLYTENSFFIFDSFQPQKLIAYTKGLLDSKKAENVLCGWVEFDGKTYKSFLYLVSAKGTLEHTEETILKLYNA